MGLPVSRGGSGVGVPPASNRFATFLMWAILGSVIVAVGVAGVMSVMSARTRSLPVLGEVTDFSLTERSGRSVSLADLAGSPWVADFIFTRCTGVCPILSSRMKELQDLLHARPDVRLVSISVDPEHDTPDVLASYAERSGADPGRWLFLTGDWSATRRLVSEGFKLAVSRSEPGEVPEGELVTHSDRIVLVDREGRIRGYYHGTEEEAVERIADDLELLD